MNDMTEKICYKLGFFFQTYRDPITERSSGFYNGDEFIGLISDIDFRTSPRLADLLENKMVEDGWAVYGSHRPSAPVPQFDKWAISRKDTDKILNSDEFDTNALAICQLFCRVYGIPWEAL